MGPGQKHVAEQEDRVAENALGDFWLWLTSLLFRKQQVEATAEQFQFEFGSQSFEFREGIAAFEAPTGSASRTISATRGTRTLLPV
jgi:hypothetical protein